MGAHWIILRHAMLRVAAQDEVVPATVGVTQLRDSVPHFDPTPELSGHERSRLLSPPIQSFQGVGTPFVAAPVF